MYKLVIEDEEGRATEIPLVREEITIGRNEGNTVRLPERNVSRRHARIFRDDAHIFLQDAGSRYGIKVNGTRINEKVQLEPGDHIQIGDYQIALHHESDEVGSVAPQTVPRDGDDRADYDPDTEVLGSVDPKADRTATPTPVPRLSSEAQLVVLSSNISKGIHQLDQRSIMIGREGDVQVLLDHASMSRTHAKIVNNGKVWSIIDQDSANGVKVNGKEVGACDLRNGDVIELGEVKLRFVRRQEQGALEGKVADYNERQASEQRKRLVVWLGVAIVVMAIAIAALWESEPPSEPAAAIPPPTATEVPAVIDPVEDALQQARGFIVRRKWSDALAHLDEALRMEPSNKDAPALRNRARAEALSLQTFQELEAAVAAADFDAIDIKMQAIGDDSVYRFEAVESASALAVERLEHYLKLGDDAEEAGDLEVALGYYESALRAEPLSVDAKRGRMLVKMSLRKKRLAPAPAPVEEAADPAAPVEGGDAAPVPRGDGTAEGAAAPATESPAAAVAAGTDIGAKPAKVESPRDPKPSKVNRKREAMLLYAKARTLLRSNPKAGAALLKRSLKLDPKLAKPHRLLGNYYAEQGKPKRACKHLKKFLRLSPQHPDGPAIREQLTKFGCGGK